MKTPPYLRASELHPAMQRRPQVPFFLRPSDYRIVDGDTIMVLARSSAGAKREEAFRIRLYAVNSPEKPKSHATDSILRSIGIDPREGNPGHAATLYMRALCRGRALFVEPRRNPDGKSVDRYGRLLADVAVSGAPGHDFLADQALAVEPLLYRNGLGVLMQGRMLPPDVPDLVARLRDHLLAHRSEAPSF
ncbi:thermonuclease family protein [Defluviimonas salinarum]|uniref:TNase-like domain-containing protein n=1 Tax=Defluviimonas salinarum TaxID=2992147 RepID=A0ABT3JAD5_9RHOB|nr:hypothetical protein [Defluviimonas salinarum]MCW3784656.1 hypothetical protein [Defluviimonas salinarum]